MTKSLERLSERLCRDIEDSMHEERFTPAILEMLDKTVDIIKDIETIKAMDEYDYSENSRGMRNGYYGRYSRDEDMMRRADRDYMR